ncbi:Ref family recombination enhancement nuclease [Sulfitobacter sp. PM12]|uniref:Ref family recombination enhancement nuclease n=1 Tax=Sulfitobacter sp. PM12 TaxID=3138497 RepID=UPI003890B78C
MNQISPRGPLGLKVPKLSAAEIREGKEWMRRVKELPCCICYKHGPSDAHHVIHGRYGTRKAPDKDTIPLCKEHHQDGPEAIHNGKATWMEKHGPDYSYLPWVAAQLGEVDY